MVVSKEVMFYTKIVTSTYNCFTNHNGVQEVKLTNKKRNQGIAKPLFRKYCTSTNYLERYTTDCFKYSLFLKKFHFEDDSTE